MNRKRKYDNITQYLKKNGGVQVTLTFTQMDELLFPKSGLPHSARKMREWWLNDYVHPENGAYGWLNAGYEVIVVNLEKEFIVFKKLFKEKNLFMDM